jgi:hypothetical protein
MKSIVLKRGLFSLTLMVAMGQAFAQSVNTVPVPEPSTISLLIAGIVALSVARRRMEK